MRESSTRKKNSTTEKHSTTFSACMQVVVAFNDLTYWTSVHYLSFVYACFLSLNLDVPSFLLSSLSGKNVLRASVEEEEEGKRDGPVLLVCPGLVQTVQSSSVSVSPGAGVCVRYAQIQHRGQTSTEEIGAKKIRGKRELLETL